MFQVLKIRFFSLNCFRSNGGNVTLTFNNQLTRGRTGNYDVHLQPSTLVPFPMAASYQTLQSPATKHVVVQPQGGGGGQLQPQPQGLQPQQQYVPVTMVEQNGRQIMAAVQAASWPTRQMALAVPSWQQLTAAANGPSAAVAAVAAAAAADNILQPLFAAAAEADWRRPLIVDSTGNLRLQEQAVFPVYDRATMAATSAAVAAANSREAALVAQQQQRNYTAVSSGSKRSTKPSQLTLHNMANNSMANNPPPAHINTHLYNSAMRYVKKEPTQLSPVKKRIKENKDHYAFADVSYSSASHSPLDHQSQYYASNVSRDNLSNAIVISDDTPPLHGR